MKDKSTKLKERLAKYGLMAAGIVGADQANAAVVYTDEVPDFAGGIGSQYFLDLNNDGTDDFRIWHNGSSNLYISPLVATNAVLGSGGATFAYPFALNLNDPINAGAGTFFTNGFAGGFQSLNYGSCSFGNWCSITDGYMGLRFDIGGNTHYGWVRLDVNASGSVWSVKDYAYEDVANASIDAGEMTAIGTAIGATAISGSDIADNNNGTDFQVNFTASTDETTLSEYRAIVVKEINVGTFDLAAAQALAPTEYFSITPNASPTYTQVLTAGATDSDGDLLAIGVAYRVFIHGVADGVNATIDAISNAASPTTLNITADVASAISGTDVNDNANGTDLEVQFTAAANESGIAEYRVIAVKTAVAGSFTLGAASALTAPAYSAVAPTGGPYTITMGATGTDSDGDPIGIGVDYTLFVLSVANGTDANIDSMASAATGVTLNVLADVAQNIVGSDIGNNAVTATDLQVDFAAASNENSVFAYRVIAVKSSAAAGFDINAASALPVSAFMPVTPSGGPYSVVFAASKTDSDGDAIANNVPYRIFIMSFADGVTANASNLAQASSDVTLVNTTGASVDENALADLLIITTEEGVQLSAPEALIGNGTSFTFTSMQGQIIQSMKIEKTITTLSTNGLSAGVYFINLTDNQGNVRSIKLFL